MGLLCFEDINHLLLWLFMTVISVSLYASIGELSRSQIRWISEEEDSTPEYSDEDSSSIPQQKFVVIFIGGLKEGDFISLIPNNVHLGNVMSKDGIWGTMTASDYGFERNELQQMFTGNDEGVGPSILSSFDRITVIGETEMALKLNIPLKIAYRFRLIDPTLEQHGFVESSRDASTVESVVDIAKRNDLWSDTKKSEVLFIFLGSDDWLHKFDGSYLKTVNMKRVFNDLDAILSALDSSHLQVTYFVTSIGLKVPLIAWGRGIRKAPSENLTIPKLVGSISTQPKNMKATTLAPMLACLLGVPPPRNSLPQSLSEYLNDPRICHLRAAQKALNLLKNQNIGAVVAWIFWSDRLITVEDADISFRKIESFFGNGDSSNGGRFAEELIEKCEMTIRYFAEVRGHLLSQVIFFTIFGCVVFGIIFACLEIDRDSNDHPLNRRMIWLQPCWKAICTTDVFFILLYMLLIALAAIDGFKWQYFLFITNLVMPWWLACRNFKILKILLVADPQRRLHSGRRVVDFLFIIVTCVICILIASQRPAIYFLVISMVVLCLIWMMTSMNLNLSLWLFSSIPFIALLSIIDTTTPDESIYLLAGSGWIIIPWLLAYAIKMKLSDCVILASSTAIIAIILLFPSQIGMNSWFSFIGVFSNIVLLPIAGSSKLIPRLIQIFVSIAAVFIILSTNGEPIFLMSFSINLYGWISAESLKSHKHLLLEPVSLGRRTEKISSSDLRRNFFFNIYCLLASTVSGETGEFRYGSWYLNEVTPYVYYAIKLCIPVFFAASIYNCILRRTGCQNYIALLLSAVHFNMFTLSAYWNAYEFAWIGNMHTVRELEPASSAMKLWCIVLICLCTANLLSCATVLERFAERRANAQADAERCRQD